MQWFRLYTEFATDPKVQMMDEALQRRLVMLFCLQCSGDLETLSDDEIAFALRITKEALHETFHAFHERGFLDENNRISNWDKRQYRSDTSTGRVRKFREKSKSTQDETFQKQDETVSVTVPDTEQIQKEVYRGASLEFWKLYPKRKGANPKIKALDKFVACCIKEGSAEPILAGARHYAKAAKQQNIINTPYVAQAITWLNQQRWKDDYAQAGGGTGNAGYIGM